MRSGSLQFYPRKRAAKFLPRVNWNVVHGEGMLGFIAYKVGMASAIVKDLTEKSMSLGKQIVLPVTILEVPNIKIYSLRFYKNGKVSKEIVVSHDKELKRKVKVGKEIKKLEGHLPGSHDYDDVKAIIYSLARETGIKKTPDLIEITVGAETKEQKLELLKSFIGKEIPFNEFAKTNLIDVRGLTRGKGFQGPVKRFGIKLRFHKSEKGVRRPGSLGPWHPARVTFRTPMAGQLGMFTRITNNLKVIEHGRISEKNINPAYGFRDYGKINSSYIIAKGSVQGPAKRQLVITPAFRPSKFTTKKKYEFMELVI